MSTITRTSDSATTVPDLILGYQAQAEGRNIVYDVIGGGIAIALIAPRPRAGTLELFYADREDAWEGYELHLSESTFTLVDSDVPEVGMTYAANTVGIALDESTRKAWTVTVEFLETT